MVKSPDAFRSIGEVARLVGVAPHVLRYWEGQFSQLSPVKRADGRRYYRPDDVRLVAGLCQVLREEGLSIRGAKLLMAGDRGAGLRDIGGARLGEALPFADGKAAPLVGPAVRLVRPSRAAPSTSPAPVSAKVTTPEILPAAPDTQAQLDLEVQPDPPLSPTWLGRLIASSNKLRQMQRSQQLTPQIAARLRELR